MAFKLAIIGGICHTIIFPSHLKGPLPPSLFLLFSSMSCGDVALHPKTSALISPRHYSHVQL